MTDTHWLFGDQSGPSFLAPGGDGPARDAPVVMIESRSVFRRRRFHRAKALLAPAAMRHRAAELGDRVTYVRADTYREGLRRAVGRGRVTVHHPPGFVQQIAGWPDERPVRSVPVPPGPASRRVGEGACPFTAGYWAFLHRHRERLGRNARMPRPVRGPERLRDLPALLE